MKFLALLSLSVSLLSASVLAQEYMPYPTAEITTEQFHAYYRQVADKHGATERRYDEHGLVTYSNEAEKTTYAFTLPNHPAYPCWITRIVRFSGGTLNLEQIGFFAGDEPAFAELFSAYERMNQGVRQEFGSEVQ